MKGKLIIWDENVKDSPIKEVRLDEKALSVVKDYMDVARGICSDYLWSVTDEEEEEEGIKDAEYSLTVIKRILKLLKEI